MAKSSKKPNPFAKGGYASMEKKEEAAGKDLDHDGERGEPAPHVQKVLKVSPAKAKAISDMPKRVMGKPYPKAQQTKKAGPKSISVPMPRKFALAKAAAKARDGKPGK
jgi:hypothetical protein